MPGKGKERITVYVDGRPVLLYRGMNVRHALMSIDGGLCAAVEEGMISVRDTNGFEVGLDGTLEDGSTIYLNRR